MLLIFTCYYDVTIKTYILIPHLSFLSGVSHCLVSACRITTMSYCASPNGRSSLSQCERSEPAQSSTFQTTLYSQLALSRTQLLRRFSSETSATGTRNSHSALKSKQLEVFSLIHLPLDACRMGSPNQLLSFDNSPNIIRRSSIRSSFSFPALSTSIFTHLFIQILPIKT